MKLPNIKILDEFNKVLRTPSKDVSFPLDKNTKDLIKDMLLYLRMSQIEEQAEKHNLRPGMGLAFIQLGIPKRIFVICHEYEDGKFKDYIVINPKIKSTSEELIYVEEGEGCLSINREIEGIIPRAARLTIEAYDEEGNLYILRIREELAVAFQHEIDHLDGILFTDHIDPKAPYKNKNYMRAI